MARKKFAKRRRFDDAEVQRPDALPPPCLMVVTEPWAPIEGARLRFAGVEAREFIRYPGGGSAVPEDEPDPQWPMGMQDATPVYEGGLLARAVPLPPLPQNHRREYSALKSALRRRAPASDAPDAAAPGSHAYAALTAAERQQLDALARDDAPALRSAAAADRRAGTLHVPRADALLDVPHHQPAPSPRLHAATAATATAATATAAAAPPASSPTAAAAATPAASPSTRSSSRSGGGSGGGLAAGSPLQRPTVAVADHPGAAAAADTPTVAGAAPVTPPHSGLPRASPPLPSGGRALRSASNASAGGHAAAPSSSSAPSPAAAASLSFPAPAAPPSSSAPPLPGVVSLGSVDQHQLWKAQYNTRRRAVLRQHLRAQGGAMRQALMADEDDEDLAVFRPLPKEERLAAFTRDVVDTGLLGRAELAEANKAMAVDYRVILASRRRAKVGCTCRFLTAPEVLQATVRKLQMTLQRAGVDAAGCSRGQLQFVVLRHSWRHGGGCMRVPIDVLEAAIVEALGKECINDLEEAAGTAAHAAAAAAIEASGGAGGRRKQQLTPSAAMAKAQVEALLGPELGSRVRLVGGDPAQALIGFLDPHESCGGSRHKLASDPLTHCQAAAAALAQWSAENEAVFLAGGGSYASLLPSAAAAAGGGSGGLSSPRSLQTRAAAQAGVACHWGTCLCCQDCCSNRPLGDPGASFVDMEADVYRSMVHVLLGQQPEGSHFVAEASVREGWEALQMHAAGADLSGLDENARRLIATLESAIRAQNGSGGDSTEDDDDDDEDGDDEGEDEDEEEEEEEAAATTARVSAAAAQVAGGAAARKRGFAALLPSETESDDDEEEEEGGKQPAAVRGVRRSGGGGKAAAAVPVSSAPPPAGPGSNAGLSEQQAAAAAAPPAAAGTAAGAKRRRPHGSAHASGGGSAGSSPSSSSSSAAEAASVGSSVHSTKGSPMRERPPGAAAAAPLPLPSPPPLPPPPAVADAAMVGEEEDLSPRRRPVVAGRKRPRHAEGGAAAAERGASGEAAPLLLTPSIGASFPAVAGAFFGGLLGDGPVDRSGPGADTPGPGEVQERGGC